MQASEQYPMSLHCGHSTGFASPRELLQGTMASKGQKSVQSKATSIAVEGDVFMRLSKSAASDGLQVHEIRGTSKLNRRLFESGAQAREEADIDRMWHAFQTAMHPLPIVNVVHICSRTCALLTMVGLDATEEGTSGVLPSQTKQKQ
eukprot:6344895-Amphidinium_carterae.1